MKLKTMFFAATAIAAAALPAFAQEVQAEAAAQPQSPTTAASLAIAAGLTMAISVVGAGAAVGRIGSAAFGAAAEKPELLSKSLTFVALAEGLSIVGFVIAMMLVNKIQ